MHQKAKNIGKPLWPNVNTYCHHELQFPDTNFTQHKRLR